MFNRSALLALVASAAVGLVTLSSTGADARPIGGGGGHRVVNTGGGHGHFNFRGSVHHAHFNHLRFNHHRRHIHYPHFRFVGCRWNWSHNCYWPHWRRYVVTTNYVNTAYPVARPVAAPCTCLVKEYLPNGAVLFRDTCTNESAVNLPAGQGAPTGS